MYICAIPLLPSKSSIFYVNFIPFPWHEEDGLKM